MRRTPRGVVTLANDRVVDWLIALVSSLRDTNPTLPIVALPFDDRVNRVREICAHMDIKLWEPADLLRECDEIARLILPEQDPEFDRTGAFRRLCAFEGPFDNFLYLDADTLVLSRLDDLFDVYEDADEEIIFTDLADGWSFLPSQRREQLLAQGAREWSSGAFFSRRSLTYVSDFAEASRLRLPPDLSILRTDVGEQPFLNWYIATTPVTAGYLPDRIDAAPTWAFQPTTTVDGELYLDDPETDRRCKVRMLHWAGIFRPSKSMPHVTRWQSAREAYFRSLPIQWSHDWKPPVQFPPNDSA